MNISSVNIEIYHEHLKETLHLFSFITLAIFEINEDFKGTISISLNINAIMSLW